MKQSHERSVSRRPPGTTLRRALPVIGALLLTLFAGARAWRAYAPSAERNTVVLVAAGLSTRALDTLECQPSDPAMLAGRGWVASREKLSADVLGAERLCMPRVTSATTSHVTVRLTRLGDVDVATRTWRVPDSATAIAPRDSVLAARLRIAGTRSAPCDESAAPEMAAVAEPTFSTVVRITPDLAHESASTQTATPTGYRVDVMATRGGVFVCPGTLPPHVRARFDDSRRTTR